METHRRPRICFVLAYRSPDYIRGRSLCEALRRSPDFDLVLAVNTAPGLRRYWQALRQLARVRREADPDLYILGFRGHEIAWPVRWLSRGKPLVLDAMMSPYAAMHEENKLGRLARWLAPIWRRYERAILHAADLVLTDTRLHADYYRDVFDLPDDRILYLPIGAVEPNRLLPVPDQEGATSHENPFRVLFYGSFLPLHGLEVILDAAARLTDLPIEFRFIGGSPGQAEQLLGGCRTRGIQRYTHERWVPFEALLSTEIPCADLCLGGSFGNTPQARRVVTGKTSQCLALGKATVVGHIDEDHGFVDRHNCLLVDQGDPAALAEAIRWSHAHRVELAAIGLRGRELYARRLSINVVVERLSPTIHRLLAKKLPDAHAA